MSFGILLIESGGWFRGAGFRGFLNHCERDVPVVHGVRVYTVILSKADSGELQLLRTRHERRFIFFPSIIHGLQACAVR